MSYRPLGLYTQIPWALEQPPAQLPTPHFLPMIQHPPSGIFLLLTSISPASSAQLCQENAISAHKNEELNAHLFGIHQPAGVGGGGDALVSLWNFLLWTRIVVQCLAGLF